MRFFKYTHPDYNEHSISNPYMPFRLAKMDDGLVYHLIHTDFTSNYWIDSEEYHSRDQLVTDGWKEIDFNDPKVRDWIDAYAADAPLPWND